MMDTSSDTSEGEFNAKLAASLLRRKARTAVIMQRRTPAPPTTPPKSPNYIAVSSEDKLPESGNGPARRCWLSTTTRIPPKRGGRAVQSANKIAPSVPAARDICTSVQITNNRRAPTYSGTLVRTRWQDLFETSSDESDTENHPPPPINVPFQNGQTSSMFRDRADADHFLSSLSQNRPPINSGRHSLAAPFVDHFRRHRIALVDHLYRVFNEYVFDHKLPRDMPVTWNSKLTSTAGLCKTSRDKADGTRGCAIVLSPKLLATADRVRDTLVHEMCHAATWIVNDERQAHGQFWRCWANGANMLFPSLPPITRCHQYKD